MTQLGEALMWFGFAVAAMGILAMAAGIVGQVRTFVRCRVASHPASSWVLRGQAFVMLGMSVATIGLILLGRLPWPFVIGTILLGVSGLVLLRARISFVGSIGK